MTVDQKTPIGNVGGMPEKRMFWSIISDYDLRTALCELVDNALDLWKLDTGKRTVSIRITLDVVRQTITVVDDAGGVRRDDLRLLVSPGGSRND
jgi:C4-dicarboxylate-specific signal transduction histidine kinase